MESGIKMSDSRNTTLTKSKKRRARVARIKVGIVLTLFLWMLISIISIIYLFIKVNALEDKMNYLLDNFTVNEEITNQVMQESVVDEPILEEMTTETEPEMLATVSDDEISASDISISEDTGTDDKVYYPTATAVGFADNLADSDDVLKAYLTFDDGPSSNTNAILDILKENDVKATFFVIGKDDEESKQLYKRIVDEGHTIAMHSYTHKYSEIYGSVEAFEADFSRIQNLIYEVTGKECLYYRFPGGSSNQVNNDDMKQCISFLNSHGITYFDWNVSSGDATSKGYTSEELVENVMKDVVKYKTSVVLMHDTAEKINTVNALQSLIDRLKGKNIDLLPIDENTTVIQHIAANSVE